MTEMARETLERLRGRDPAAIAEALRQLAYALGGGSDQYLELLDEAVAAGLLDPDDVERVEER